VLTGGPDKKLRADHYLENLSAEQLEELRWVLSAPGTLQEQRLLCPKRQGGPRDGELPVLSLLSEISQAMRQAAAFNEVRFQQATEAAASQRCKELGLDPTLTNAVLRVIGEEALAQKAEKKLGSFALGAASILLNAESTRTKGKQEEEKLTLKKQAEKRMQEKLQFERDKVRVAEAKLKATQEQVAKLRDVKAPMTDADRRAIVDKIDEIMGLPKGQY